jgi:membrane protein YqaA with SNARE-associated domain
VLRRCLDWVLHRAETANGAWDLFALAFCKSSFFPISPDVPLIALPVIVHTRLTRYALGPLEAFSPLRGYPF